MMIGKINSQNRGISIATINRSIAHKNEAITGTRQEEKISAVISPVGKKQSMLQQLMKQKQDLTDRMKSLSVSALEKGTDVKGAMEEYRKQLKAIDEQILKMQMEQEDKENDEKIGVYENPRTKSEVEAQKMKDIMSLYSSSKQVEIVSSEKDHMSGETKILNAEIKTGYGNIESKLEKVAELEHKSANLASDIGKRLVDVNDGVADIQDRIVQEENVAEPSNTSQDTEVVKELRNYGNSTATDESGLLNSNKQVEGK